MKSVLKVLVVVAMILALGLGLTEMVVPLLERGLSSEWEAGLVAGAVAFVVGVLAGVRLNQTVQDRHAQNMTALLWTQADITRHTAGMGKEFARADREQAGMEAKLRFMEEKRTDQILGQIANTVVRHTARQQAALPDSTWQVGEGPAMPGAGVRLIGQSDRGAGAVERYD